MIIDALESDANLQQFLQLPHGVYRYDKHYIAESVDKSKHSLLRDCYVGRQKAFVCTKSGAAVARVAARISPVLKDERGAPLGMLGFFEAENDPAAVDLLLTEAIAWLRAQLVQTIIGPMDGDTWHRYRFNVGPFEDPPFLMEPYNKSYYPILWERVGFRPLEHYYSKQANAAAAAAPLAKIHQRVLDRGYQLRCIDMRQFDREMEIIYRLSTTIFADNFLYEPISLDDFLTLYRPARSLIDPALVRIAVSPDGEPVGFVFSIVDYQRAVAAMQGRGDWLARLRFVLHRRAAQAVNIKSLGVVPSHRHVGLAAALMCESYRTALQKGFSQANLCLIREGNPSGRLDGAVGTVSRRYVLYQLKGDRS